jgi:hypothetical protein
VIAKSGIARLDLNRRDLAATAKLALAMTAPSQAATAKIAEAMRPLTY